MPNRIEPAEYPDSYHVRIVDAMARISFKGKRLKVVLRKASKKLNLPKLAPDSPQHAAWVKYYEDLMAIIANDMKIEAYQQDKLSKGTEP